MDANTQMYFDLIKDQLELAKQRLTPEQFTTLIDNLTDHINGDDEVEEEEIEEEEEDEDA